MIAKLEGAQRTIYIVHHKTRTLTHNGSNNKQGTYNNRIVALEQIPRGLNAFMAQIVTLDCAVVKILLQNTNIRAHTKSKGTTKIKQPPLYFAKRLRE